MFLGLVATVLDDVLSLAMRAENTRRPADLPNGFEAPGIVDEVLDLHQPSAGSVFDFHASFSGVLVPKSAYATSGFLSSLRLPLPSLCTNPKHIMNLLHQRRSDTLRALMEFSLSVKRWLKVDAENGSERYGPRQPTGLILATAASGHRTGSRPLRS